jgi:hypothetical protein
MYYIIYTYWADLEELGELAAAGHAELARGLRQFIDGVGEGGRGGPSAALPLARGVGLRGGRGEGRVSE